MTAEQRRGLRALEGRLVHVALADGSRLDDVALVSAGRTSLWVFSNGEDVFVPVGTVVDAWEGRPFRSAA
ncbi:MAG TPA: hypothetical protein VHF00_06580 [Acidimicrobiales bacterium]|nr:hypothetical protein [Acidimicrobiales bacterium]